MSQPKDLSIILKINIPPTHIGKIEVNVVIKKAYVRHTCSVSEYSMFYTKENFRRKRSTVQEKELLVVFYVDTNEDGSRCQL